jgi:hypothetical protein
LESILITIRLGVVKLVLGNVKIVFFTIKTQFVDLVMMGIMYILRTNRQKQWNVEFSLKMLKKECITIYLRMFQFWVNVVKDV